MEHVTAVEQGVPVLRLSGRFDAFEVEPVRTWVTETINADTPSVVIDLSGVTFIDSSALAVLVKGMKACREHDGDLHLAGLEQAVRIIFELTRLDKAFKIYDSADEAVTALL
ncbi:MAG: STAS domain-containing protein [Chloroflexota bacterium]